MLSHVGSMGAPVGRGRALIRSRKTGATAACASPDSSSAPERRRCRGHDAALRYQFLLTLVVEREHRHIVPLSLALPFLRAFREKVWGPRPRFHLYRN